MGITDKVRKDLWAKSGNRCAICKKEFFTSIDTDDFNIGDECHIVSSKPNGPRHLRTTVIMTHTTTSYYYARITIRR